MWFSKWSLDSYDESKEFFSEKSSIVQAQSDVQLVIRAQNGDKAAFDLICGRFYHQIYRFQSRMVGDSWIGEDLAQETFLKAWRALNALVNHGCQVIPFYSCCSGEGRTKYRPSCSRSGYNQK